MKPVVTTGIVLKRTNYQEADRIITVLTPGHGKLRLIAKGVRKQKSKLAGGIELFSTSHITYIPGRKEIGTLISSRLIKHFSYIVGDMSRTMIGYELIKLLNRATEDNTGEEYYHLLETSLSGLNDLKLEPRIVELWFNLHLLITNGHQPNLVTDQDQKLLNEKILYSFDITTMGFHANPDNGTFSSKHIKLLRLCVNVTNPKKLAAIKGVKAVLPNCLKLSQSMLGQFVRV